MARQRTAQQGTAQQGTAQQGTAPEGTGREGAARAGAVRAGTRNPLVIVALALAVCAAGAAGWGGWLRYEATHDDAAAFARTRDDALAAGEQAVQNMNTLDHRSLEKGLDSWEQSTTGDLHRQLVDGRDAFATQIAEAKTVSTAEVLSGAVTELDERAGRAGVMVALRVTVTAPKGEPAVKESRLLGSLTRTAGGWKLSALGQAPVGGTGG
ncbi:nuclear transport factor 2 family protein [Streptomyces anulatus]|uniref:nuclear transport factor 2 family protein n=1 Tax=Streptomyces anulatus TaxID=1892 RepID=UPI0036850C71